MSRFVTGFVVFFITVMHPLHYFQLSDKMFFTASKQTKTFTLTSHNLQKYSTMKQSLLHVSEHRLKKINFPEFQQCLFKWNNEISNQLIITAVFNLMLHTMLQLPNYHVTDSWKRKNSFIYIYIFIHVCACTCAHIYIHTSMYVCTAKSA